MKREKFSWVNVFEQKVRCSTSHEYFNQWFSAIVDSKYPFIKQDSEVEAIRWFGKDEIARLLKENPEQFVPYFNKTIGYFINNENKN